MAHEGAQRGSRIPLSLRSRKNPEFASACSWKGRSGGRLMRCWDGDVVRIGCRERNGMSRDGTVVARGRILPKGMSIAVLLDTATDSMMYGDWSWCAGYSNHLICDDIVAIHPIYCQKMPCPPPIPCRETRNSAEIRQASFSTSYHITPNHPSPTTAYTPHTACLLYTSPSPRD